MAACSCHGVSDGECEMMTDMGEKRVTDFYFYFFKTTDPVCELLAQLQDMSFKINEEGDKSGEVPRFIKATKTCTMSRTLAYDDTFRTLWNEAYDGYGHWLKNFRRVF